MKGYLRVQQVVMVSQYFEPSRTTLVAMLMVDIEEAGLTRFPEAQVHWTAWMFLDLVQGEVMVNSFVAAYSPPQLPLAR